MQIILTVLLLYLRRSTYKKRKGHRIAVLPSFFPKTYVCLVQDYDNI